MSDDTIRVLVVDDHKVVRNGLRVFLSLHDDIRLVGEAANGEEAVAACAELAPDVVLMDLMMPVMDGPTATARIRADFPGVQVIALTSYDDADLVRRAVGAGAISYLLKDADESEITLTIRLAAEGRAVLSPEAMQALLKESDPAAVRLTEREQEILVLMATGITNPQIAKRLDVSISTANFHVHNILTKLGAKTRTEAVAIATREGLLAP